jgi:hypothetical protein
VRLVQKPHNPGLLQAFLLKLAHIRKWSSSVRSRMPAMCRVYGLRL